MTTIEKRLINAYAVLVLAEKISIQEIPDKEITLDDGTKSTMRSEVEIKVAEKTIEILSV